MVRRIVWSDPAVQDLESAVEFIAKDSEAYARSLAQLAVDAASCRLIYLVEAKRVLIVGVLHGHRALRQALKGHRSKVLAGVVEHLTKRGPLALRR